MMFHLTKELGVNSLMRHTSNKYLLGSRGALIATATMHAIFSDCTVTINNKNNGDGVYKHIYDVYHHNEESYDTKHTLQPQR